MTTLSKKQLIVRNLPQGPDSKIRDLFEKYGKIIQWNLKTNSETNKKEIHIEFETEDVTILAKKEVNNTVFEECILQVEISSNNSIHITSTSSTTSKTQPPLSERIKKAIPKPDLVKSAEKQIILKKNLEQNSGQSIEDRLVINREINREIKFVEKPELTIIKAGASKDDENRYKKIDLRIQKYEDKSFCETKLSSEKSDIPIESASYDPLAQTPVEAFNQIQKVPSKETDKFEEEKISVNKPVDVISNTRSESNERSQYSNNQNNKNDSIKTSSRSKSRESKQSRQKETKYIEGGLIVEKPVRSRSRDKEKPIRERNSSRFHDRERDRDHERDRERDLEKIYRGYDSREQQVDYKSSFQSRDRDHYKRDIHNYDSSRESRYDNKDYSSHYNKDYHKDRDRRSSSRDRRHSDLRNREFDSDKHHHRSYDRKDRDYRDDGRYKDHDREHDRDRKDYFDRDKDYNVYKGERERDYYDRHRDSRDRRDNDYSKKDHYDGSHQSGYDSYSGFGRDKDYHNNQRDRHDDDYHSQSKSRDHDRDRSKRSNSRSRSRYEDNKYSSSNNRLRDWRDKSQSYSFQSKMPELRHSSSYPGSQSFTMADPLIPLIQNTLSNPITQQIPGLTGTISGVLSTAIPALTSVLSAPIPGYPLSGYPYYTNPYSTQNFYSSQAAISINPVTPTTNTSMVVEDNSLLQPERNVSSQSDNNRLLNDLKYDNTSQILPKSNKEENFMVVETDNVKKHNLSNEKEKENKNEQSNVNGNEKEQEKEKGIEGLESIENNSSLGNQNKRVEILVDPAVMNEFSVYPKELMNKLLKFYYSAGNFDLLRAELSKPNK